MLVVVAFVFGLIVGSFLNVCIYRLPRPGMSVVKPRSHCPACSHPIAWYDNIPLFSYLFLIGKCRHCHQVIGWRYPLVELLTGIFFALAAYLPPTAFGVPQRILLPSQEIVLLVITIYLLSVLIITTFIDLEFRIIPDELTISGIILAPLCSFFFPFIHKPLPFLRLGGQRLLELSAGQAGLNSLMAALFGMLVGGGIIYFIGFVGKLIFRKEAMGMGDVKLMCLLGGFLGWEAVIFIFFAGCLFGSIAGIISWMITKDHYIAFGPYLALGAVMMIFLKPFVISLFYQGYPELVRQVFNL